LGGVAAQEERTIDRPMTVEKFSMGGRGVRYDAPQRAKLRIRALIL
jgi:hypothetical protein